MVVVDSHIEAVKVYRAGATVRRRLSLSVSAGQFPDEIEVGSLPLSLYDPTVRLTLASVDDGCDVVIGDLRVGLAPRKQPHDEEEPDRAALKTAEREAKSKERRLDQLGEEIRMLEAVPVPARAGGREGRPPPSSPLAARLALAHFTDESLKTRRAEQRALLEEQQVLARRIAELKAALERASTSRRVSPGDLVKTVVAQLRTSKKKPRRAELVLEYFVPGARWAPSYQCHLSRDGRDAAIQLRALVCQRTGEDWRGVRLSLSTAAPIRWTEMPELPAIRIGRAQPAIKPSRGFRPPPKGALALFADYDGGREKAVGLLPRTTSWTPQSLSLAPLDGERTAPGSTRADVRSRTPPLPPPGAPMPAAPFPHAMRSRAVPQSELDVGTAEGDPELDDDDGSYEGADAAALSVVEPLDSAEDEADAFEASTDVEARALRDTGAGPMRRAPGPAGSRERLGVGVEALLFTHLELGGPDDRTVRNRLRAFDQSRAYLELLARARVTVTFDVMACVRDATADAEAVAALPLPDGAVDVARVSGNYDFAYDADDPVDVSSDGVWSSVPLGTRSCEADLRYVVVPREDTNVYRVAMLKNPTRAPLLAGPTEVYVGGEYVLTTRLPTVAPGGELRLGLGVEQAIKCARNTRFSERHSGDRVGMTLLDHRIEIDLVNHLTRDAICEVRERIPQPAPAAEVMIEEEGVEPAWEPYDQEERGALIHGGRRWNVTVPKEGELKLRAGYVVRIYANTELVGGNRREA